MKRPSVFGARSTGGDVTMTPMIDVVFLLLIFFIWTASFQIVEQVLPSQLSAVQGSQPAPPDVPPPEADFDRVVVRLYWDGAPRWTINDVDVGSLAEVRTRLTTIAGIKADAPLILHPDVEVPMGHVIDAYDVSRLAGFTAIQFAARE